MQTLTHTLHRAVLLLALTLVAGLWLAPTTFAQPTPEQMQERMAAQTDSLINYLGLSADQEQPVRDILEASNAKRMEIRNNARASGSFTGIREDMAALNEETTTKLGEVLTEKQMTLYKQYQEEQRTRRRGRRGF